MYVDWHNLRKGGKQEMKKGISNSLKLLKECSGGEKCLSDMKMCKIYFLMFVEGDVIK